MSRLSFNDTYQIHYMFEERDDHANIT